VLNSDVKSRKVKGRGAAGASQSLTRRIILHCLCTILPALILLLAVATALPAATLEGTVLDPSGGAVAGARVSLLAPLTPVDERQTDAQGRFEFAGLRGGAYKLVASRPGFAASSSQVELRANETRRLELRLALSAVEQHVVVSATLGDALAPQIGSSVSVLTQHDIDERGAQTVLEVLRDVPGVDVNQTGRRGGATGVFLRGGNSNYNLVLIDGIQVNQFGGDFDFASLPADGVDHVEVIRGPQSALYGSNAVTGVINIVSQRGEGPPHFTVLAEGGSFTTRRFSTGASGLTRGLSWAYDLSRLDSGGVVANDQFRAQSAFLSLGYSRSPRRRVNFHFFGNANDAGPPGPYGSDPLGLFTGIDRVSRDKQNLFAYQVSYAEQVSPRFRQVVTGNVATNDLYFRSPFGDSFSNNLRGVVNTRSEITVSRADFLVAGFEYNREQIKNTFIADASDAPFLLPRTSLAYFAENRWSPASRLFLTTGVRVDDIRTHQLPAGAFGVRPLLPPSSVVKVNPRVSVALLARQSGGTWLGITRLHAAFGTGIRAPSGFELAFTDNPRLKPERSVSFDTGIEQRFFSDRAIVDVTYFFNRFKDQIVVLGGSPTNLSSFVSDNLANSRAEGAEVSFRFRPTGSVELTTYYTRLDSSLLALDGSSLAQSPFRVGQPLLRRPRNSGGFNATWQRGRLMLNLNGYLRGKVLDVEPNLGASRGLFTNKGYVLANAGFAYRLPRGVELYGRLNNFLNQKYEESFGYPALHLNFLAGVRFSFPAE
jgi:outer membrane cobalamin receptor